MPDTVLFSWHCPFCEHHAAITYERYSADVHYFEKGNKHGHRGIKTEVIVCPNPECREFVLQVSLHEAVMRSVGVPMIPEGEPLSVWPLIPPARIRVFPDYVPEPILDDYREACLIRTLSPKASATLSRRCLQGMIRDFWRVSKRRLVDEIEAIKDKVDPVTWNAIDAVRNIGNIGAHMEQDINLVIDVEPEEAGLLIGLIETLIDDWYVARHEREQRMARIVSAAADKKLAKGASKLGE